MLGSDDGHIIDLFSQTHNHTQPAFEFISDYPVFALSQGGQNYLCMIFAEHLAVILVCLTNTNMSFLTRTVEEAQPVPMTNNLCFRHFDKGT